MGICTRGHLGEGQAWNWLILEGQAKPGTAQGQKRNQSWNIYSCHYVDNALDIKLH